MAATEPLADFFARAVLAAGGLASVEDGRLEAILPPDLARTLECEETVSWGLESVARAGLYDGSPLVGRVAGAFSRRGRLAGFAVETPSRKPDLLRSVERGLDLVNAAGSPGPDEEAWASQLFVVFAWSATADEKRDGLLEVAVDEETALPSPHRLASLLAEPRTDRAHRAPSPGALRAAFERAAALAAERAALEVEPFRRAVDRRLQRDVQRLRDYYRRLVEETRGAASRSRSAANREARQAKVPVILAERDRKVADLTTRYSVEVVLEPVVAVRVQVPGRRIHWDVRRRDEVRRLTLFHDLLAGSLRPVPCDGCRRGTGSLWMCAAFHGLCSSCRRTCPECGKNLCAVCDAGHESRHS